MSGTLLLVESLVRRGAKDAGEVLTLQRAAYVTEAQAHADLNLPPLRQSFAEMAAAELTPRAALRLFTGEHSAGNLRLYARLGYRESLSTAHAGRLPTRPPHQGPPDVRLTIPGLAR